MIQMHAFYVFLVIAGFLILCFIYVALSTLRPRDTDYHAAYSLRKKLLFVVLLVLLAGLTLTLGKTPYPRSKDLPSRVVFVVGKQFSFGISDSPISNEGEYEAATYANPVQLPRDSLVEFRVTSFDVNHGFGVFSPSGTLIAQVQAMPGYVNRLRVRFHEPGQYNVMCLELCGMSHHRMRNTFVVQ